MTALQDSAQMQLRRHVERIERLDAERRETAAEIKDELAAAKASGFDVKIIRKVLALRRMERHARQEQAALLDTYCHALGMLEDTPLGDWSRRQEAAAATQRLDAEHGGAEATISVNGGPQVPLSAVKEALGVLKGSAR